LPELYVGCIFTPDNNNTKTNDMTRADLNNKANELNSRFPNLKCEVVEVWGGSLAIKTINSDKAKTLNEMFKGYTFTF
jgi:hypothetical protein